ncbi:MAG TPA: hypothetical protein VF131_16945 [Blastocatellia bacterium]|nr:hypothetical protein [Blastocatellia bacterium]
MELYRTSTFLRRVLFADAATCAAAGLLMLLGAGLLEQDFGLPRELSRYAGIGLLPFAAFLVYLATRANLSQTALWAVIVLNVLWTVDSILLLVSGWIEPTGFGYAFVILQAIGVATFAGLEYFGLRKSAMAVA